MCVLLYAEVAHVVTDRNGDLFQEWIYAVHRMVFDHSWITGCYYDEKWKAHTKSNVHKICMPFVASFLLTLAFNLRYSIRKLRLTIDWLTLHWYNIVNAIFFFCFVFVFLGFCLFICVFLWFAHSFKERGARFALLMLDEVIIFIISVTVHQFVWKSMVTLAIIMRRKVVSYS